MQYVWNIPPRTFTWRDHLQLWTFLETVPETKHHQRPRGWNQASRQKVHTSTRHIQFLDRNRKTQRVLRAMCLCQTVPGASTWPWKAWKGDHLFKELNTGTGKGGPIHPSLQGFWWFASHFFRGYLNLGKQWFPDRWKIQKHISRKIFTYMCLTFFSSHLWNLSTKMDHYLESSPNIGFFFRPKVSIVAGKFGNVYPYTAFCVKCLFWWT